MKEPLTATDFYFGLMLILGSIGSYIPTIVCAVLAGYGLYKEHKERNHD